MLKAEKLEGGDVDGRDTQCAYNATFRRVRETTVAVEKQ